VARAWQDDAPKPSVMGEQMHLRDPLLYRLKCLLLGKPLNRHTLNDQRLSKRHAYGILSSDCISSSAYGTEQILIALIPAFGLLAFSLLTPMVAVILCILLLVTLSYNNVISTYTKTGGAYIVARENLGVIPSQIAAVELIFGYIITVAIQSTAGVAAITSAFPALADYRLVLIFVAISTLTYINLRGVKDAGLFFVIPSYLFIGSMLTVFAFGLYRFFDGSLPKFDSNQPGLIEIGDEKLLLSFIVLVFILKAFANGSASLTGLEAISDSVAYFKTPEEKNARQTLVLMASTLALLIVGITWLAHQTQVIPFAIGTPTVISQLAEATLGQSTVGDFLYYTVQLATTLILFAGANTCFSAYPNMVKIFADDGFLPKRLTARGHKLVFSNGIIFLTSTAIILVLITNGSITALAAIYALCVFVGFTITGLGMFRHSQRVKPENWKLIRIVHGASGIAAAIVVLIISTVRFADGTWLVVLGTPLVILFTLKFNKQYSVENTALEVKLNETRISNITRHDVTVLVAKVDLATMATVRYARTLKSRRLEAVHFVLDDMQAAALLEEWSNHPGLSDIALQLIDCPDRRLTNSVLDYALRATEDLDVELTLLLPNRIFSRFFGRLLHDQTAESIASAITQLDRVVATIVPFDVEKILDGKVKLVPSTEEKVAVVNTKTSVKPEFESPVYEPVGHHAKSGTKIGAIQWRKRAEVVGRVTGIRVAPKSSAPLVEIEIWDETGGVRLQFIGRREIAGLEVGSTLKAEGMVGELDGKLTILNPSYEIII